MEHIYYCKSNRRRPIRAGFPCVFRDIQADLPYAWCSVCGSEVFDLGQNRCARCRKKVGGR